MNGNNSAAFAPVNREGNRPRVLVVDDDRNLSRLVKTILHTAEFEVLTAFDGLDALHVVEEERLDAIVLDLRMPNLDGRGFFRELRARDNGTPVLVASAYGARSAQAELGAEAAIEKPFDPDALIRAVSDLVQGQAKPDAL